MNIRQLRAGISVTALALIGSAALAATLPAPAPESGVERAHMLLVFHSMYGVDGPFVGEAFPQRGIPGGELPWTVESANGWLDTDGHLTLQVKGIVFTDDDEVPPNLRGTNDEPTFRAAISCITESGDRIVRRNVITDPFPATPEGDARVKTTVELPNPCAEPTLFILAGSEDKWFAVVGFESEEEE